MHRNVLIIDDTELLRCLMSERLDVLPLGLIAGASTPDEAIRLAQDLNPDLIVVDCTVGTAGNDLLAVLRCVSPQAQLVAVVLRGDTQAAATASRAGADTIVWKPYSRDTVLAALCGNPATERILMPSPTV